MLRFLLNQFERIFHVEVTRVATELYDLQPEMVNIVESVRPYTMTSLSRLAALCNAIDYVVKRNIPGAFVECGVWRGGSSMAAAQAYRFLGREDVDLYLFDTFEGMTTPGDHDVHKRTGESAGKLLSKSQDPSGVRAYASLDDVRNNLIATGYPLTRLHFVQGPVEKTIPEHAPEQIAVLRLDTDWYASTKHELDHLFPRLSPNGILIIDDYGDWEGAKKAVDEYFISRGQVPFLNRIDNTGRLLIKDSTLPTRS